MSSRIYILDHPDIPYLPQLSYITIFLSTIVNIFGFHMLLFHSQKENKTYRYQLLISQFFLYSSQAFWGICQCTVPLLPFPGFISLGLLRYHLSTFTLCLIWGPIFSTYCISILVILFVRLSIIQSYNNLRIANVVKYIPIILVIGAFALTPITICTLLDNNIPKFMNEQYPEYLGIQNVPGIFIVANNTIMAVSCFSAVMVYVLFGLLYITLCYRIFEQVKSQQNKMSRVQKNHQRKVLIELSIQTIIKMLSIGMYASWWTFLFVFAPREDLNYLTLICHTSFVGAAIPGTLFMLYQHPTYLRKPWKQQLPGKASTIPVRSTVFIN